LQIHNDRAMLLNLDTEQNKKIAIWGIVFVCLISIALRFWGLGRFNVLVFDEFYYARFANNYLNNTKFYNSHPPLSQYLIAIGIWIGDRLPIGQDTANTLTGSLHSTFSYRWINSLFGSLIPPIVASLAYQLTQRLSYAFLAALFISLDGLFLVESRYALNNIFLIFFGLLGQLLVLIASKYNGNRQLLFLVAGGISFGASAACKWNGLSFLVGIYLLLAIAKIWSKILRVIENSSLIHSLFARLSTIYLLKIAFLLAIVIPTISYGLIMVLGLLWPYVIVIMSKNGYSPLLDFLNSVAYFGKSDLFRWLLLGIYLLWIIDKIWQKIVANFPERNLTNSLFDRLSIIDRTKLTVTLVIIPPIVYSLLWIPHLRQNPIPNFIDVQWSILNYHKQVNNGTEIHPYCANWYTWPLLMRPLAYHFQEYKPNYYYDVHAMGNPLLWWLALATIFASIWLIITAFVRKPIQAININIISIPLFIVINYTANLLPWVKVTRCVFIYHYLGAVLFAIVGLAWLVDNWLRSGSKLWQGVGLTTIFSITATFIFWLPIYLGLPIERTDLSLRLWNFWLFNWI
jgi:dolichyl-phosphate-mannose-protein mannosyltransferase